MAMAFRPRQSCLLDQLAVQARRHWWPDLGWQSELKSAGQSRWPVWVTPEGEKSPLALMNPLPRTVAPSLIPELPVKIQTLLLSFSIFEGLLIVWD